MKVHSTHFFDRPRVRTIIFMLATIMGVLYFFQITSNSVRGYQLKHVSDQKNMLQGETTRLDFSIAGESSAQNLKKRLDALGFSSATNIEYIRKEDNSVAFR